MTRQRSRRSRRTAPHRGPRRQRGVALIALLTLVVLLGTGLLLNRLNESAQSRINRDLRTGAALAEARAALIQWAVSNPETPGMLPLPDRNVDGGTPNYDGYSDCVPGTGNVNQSHLIGRFPFRGSDSVESCGNGQAATWPMDVYPRDDSGEPLFYAVSLNLVRRRGDGAGGADAAINPGLLDLAPPAFPWLQVLDANGNVLSDRVAAVIIAPGEALPGQSHSGTAPDVDQYLDTVTVAGVTYDNADSNGCPDPFTTPCDGDGDGIDDGETFIAYPHSDRTAAADDAFNDRLTYITVDELMRAVEKRVIGEVATLLEDYRSRYGGYPWLATYEDPTAASYDTAWGVREGLIPYIDWIAGEALADFPTPFAVRWTSTAASRSLTGPTAIDPLPAPWELTLTSQNAIINSITAALSDDGPNAFSIPPPPTGDGACDWSGVAGADSEVSCTATVAVADAGYTVTICYPFGGDPCYFAFYNLPVARTYTFDVVYTGDASLSAAGSVKARDVASVGSATGPINDMVQVSDTIIGGSFEIGTGSLTLTPAAGAAVTTSGIYFGLVDWDETGADPLAIDGAGDVEDAFPAWFVDNQWYRYTYAAVSGAYTARETTGVTGQDSAGNTLASPGQQFTTLGVAVGDLVERVSDGASGTVTAVVDDTTLTVPLDGGAGATWSPGDQYVVWPAPVTGLAGGGSTAVALEDLGQDFLAADVSAGDRVYNVTDGSSGSVTAVTATEVTVDGLAGGAGNDFDPGDRYRVMRCTRPPAAAGTPSTATDCLVVNIDTAGGGGLARERRDVRALVLGSGGALAGQDRDSATGPSACVNGLPFLCDYFELDDTDKVTTGEDLVFLRNGLSDAPAFNDQLRIASPPPL